MTRRPTLIVLATFLALAGCSKRVMIVDHAHTAPDLQARISNYAEAELQVLKRYHFASNELPVHRALPAPDDGKYGHFSMEFSPSSVALSVVEVANAVSGCSAEDCPTVRLVELEFSYFDLTDIGSMTADVNASATIAVEGDGLGATNTIKGPLARVIGPKCYTKLLDQGHRTNECFRRSFSVIIADATLRSMLAALVEEEQHMGSN